MSQSAMQEEPLTAYVDLILSMIFLGSTYVLAKLLLLSFPILLLLCLRFLIGSLFFGVVCFATRHANDNSRLTILFSQHWRLLILQSLFGAFLFNFFMLLGIKYTTASTSAIITSTIPIFISLFAVIFLKERLSGYKILAIFISVIGILLVTINFSQVDASSHNMLGNSFIFLSVIAGALFPICAKRLPDSVPHSLLSFAFNLFGLIPFVVLSLPELFNFSFSTVSMQSWIYLVLYSLMLNVLYLIFWNRGVRRIPASTASLFIAVMPIVATVLAYFFLHESLNFLQMIGMSLIILSMAVGVCRLKR